MGAYWLFQDQNGPICRFDDGHCKMMLLDFFPTEIMTAKFKIELGNLQLIDKMKWQKNFASQVIGEFFAKNSFQEK